MTRKGENREKRICQRIHITLHWNTNFILLGNNRNVAFFDYISVGMTYTIDESTGEEVESVFANKLSFLPTFGKVCP